MNTVQVVETTHPKGKITLIVKDVFIPVQAESLARAIEEAKTSLEVIILNELDKQGFTDTSVLKALTKDDLRKIIKDEE